MNIWNCVPTKKFLRVSLWLEKHWKLRKTPTDIHYQCVNLFPLIKLKHSATPTANSCDDDELMRQTSGCLSASCVLCERAVWKVYAHCQVQFMHVKRFNPEYEKTSKLPNKLLFSLLILNIVCLAKREHIISREF